MKITLKVKPHQVWISTQYIRLDDMLKYAGAVATGGQAKLEIQQGKALVNGEPCLQRGKKLYPGDKVVFDQKTYEVCADEGQQA